MSDQREFPGTPRAVTAARRFAVGALAGTRAGRSPDVVEAVALVVSELASNSVRHAQTPFRVRIDTSRTAVRVEVSDGGGGTPSRRAPSPRATSGRGLQLVESFADEWGVVANPTGTGKTVWFRITLPERVPS